MTYSSDVLSDSPLAYWRMGDASTTMADSSGNSRAGTHSSNTGLAAGLLTSDADGSRNYTGSNPSTSSVATGSWMNTSSVTAEAWIYATATTSDRNIVAHDESGTGNELHWRLRISAGKLVGIVRAGGTNTTLTGTTTVDTGRRYYVALTYDGTTLCLYLDGNLEASTVLSAAMNVASTAAITIGRLSTSSQLESFAGQIDEVAVYGTALSATRLRAHYLSGAALTSLPYKAAVLDDRPQAYYRLGDPPPLAISAATANSSYSGEGPEKAYDGLNSTFWTTNSGSTGWLRYQLPSAAAVTSYTLVRREGANNRMPNTWTFEGSNDGTTFTTLDTRSGISFATLASQTFTFSNATTYLYYRINVTANNGDANLNIADMFLNSTGFVRDSSGYGRDGTHVASPPAATGLLTSGDTDPATSFNGSNQYVNVAYGAWMQPSAISLEAIVKPSTTSSGQTIMGRTNFGVMSATQYQAWLSQQGTTIKWSVVISTNTYLEISSASGTIASGGTYHVVGTFDGTTLRLYINGVQATSGTLSGALAGASTQPLQIGGVNYNGQRFTGVIDEAAYYSQALSSTRVAAHYAAGFSGGGGTTITTGRATETDLARALTKVVTRVVTVGRATSMEVARALTVVKGARVITTGRASVTNLARPLVRLSPRIITPARRLETDTARHIFIGQKLYPARKIETDAARALTVQASNVIRIGTQVVMPGEPPLGGGPIGGTGETLVEVSPVETDVARHLLTATPYSVSRAVETDTARHLTVALGGASTFIGRASEADLIPNRMNVGIRLRMLAAVGDTALPLTVVRGPAVKNLARVQEADTARALAVRSIVRPTLSRITEVDLTRHLGLGRGLSRVVEHDATLPLSLLATRKIQIGQKIEVDHAFPLGLCLRVGRKVETDLARSLGLRKSLLRAGEIDLPAGLTLVRRIVKRRILVDGEIRTVVLLGVWDGERLWNAREMYFDESGIRPLETELV